LPQSTYPDTIEAELFGRPTSIAVTVPQGPSTLLDLLPVARALADAVSSAGIDDARQKGRCVSCSAGCAACCRQMVGISAVEAQSLAELVAGMPPERRAVIESRFAQAVLRLETAELLDPQAPKGQRRLAGTEPSQTRDSGREASARYFALHIACPFLENESCSIYGDRPMICREYNVTSPPEDCATFRHPGVKRIALPLYGGGPLGRVSAKLTGVSITTMPITLALEWSAVNAQRITAGQDGQAMYDTWVSSIDADHETPLDQR
jgi:Fe-S-cluster containining protein